MDNETKGKLIALQALITETLLVIPPSDAQRALSAAKAACFRSSSDIATHSSAVWNDVSRRVPNG